MNDVRLKLTNEEKLAQEAVGLESTNFHMNEHNIDDLIAKQKAEQFNDELDSYVEEFKLHQENLKELANQMGSNPEKLEIKPMQDQVLIKPFEHNPFQKMEVKNGIIIDSGGFKANVDKNPMTGQYEEQVQVILTGCVMEVGPETKYLKVGDVVFYHRRDVIPIPFFKQGLYNLCEYRVLAVVNENLSKRFDEIKANSNA